MLKPIRKLLKALGFKPCFVLIIHTTRKDHVLVYENGNDQFDQSEHCAKAMTGKKGGIVRFADDKAMISVLVRDITGYTML